MTTKKAPEELRENKLLNRACCDVEEWSKLCPDEYKFTENAIILKFILEKQKAVFNLLLIPSLVQTTSP